MGRLIEPAKWAEVLPQPVTAELAAWLERRSFVLRLRSWFTDGRSGAPVALTVRERSDGDSEQLVLKFWNVDGRLRAEALADAWHDSPHYQEHLANVVGGTVELGDWRAVLMDVAAGNMRHIVPLSRLLADPRCPDYCATIVRSVLGDWNQQKTPRRRTTAADLLGKMLVRHRDSITRWARSAGVGDVDQPVRFFGSAELDNPLALVSGPAGATVIDDLIIGRAHGDLSGRNILVPAKPDVAAERYVLIDYDRYADSAPLTRDPMHLLVALALDSFEKFSSERLNLARVIVHPNAQVAAWLDPFQQISAAIHRASQEMAERRSWGAQWEDQCLLSLVGAGLIHVGRELHVEDQQAAKEWCFLLAALAADEYMHRTRAEDLIERTRSTPAAAGSRSLNYRRQELAGLLARLSDGPWGVLVVQGMRGIGKTVLVNEALTELSAPGADVQVRRHDVNALVGLDAPTLVDSVLGPMLTSDGENRGSALVRLEHGLRLLGDTRVVVHVDSAENLADHGTGRLVDPELDDVLELIATEPGHRVIVFLTTRDDVHLPDDRMWPTERLNIGKLRQDEFLAYLASLDQRGSLDSSDLPERSRARLYSKLQGNPRLAQLVHGILTADRRLDLAKLTDRLANQDASKVPGFLTRLLIDHLSAPRRRVLEALAAFGTPVPEAAVVRILAEEDPDEVGRALAGLTEDGVVHRLTSAVDQYVIPPDDGRLALEYVTDEGTLSELYAAAADVLAEFRVAQPERIEDLRMHLAEVRALLQAGEPDFAYQVVEDINEILRAWNCTDLLLQYRIQLRTSLADDHLRMANENALGGLYLARGDYKEADKAFGNAMSLGGPPQDDMRSVKARTNLAMMYREMNETDLALGYYQLCLDEADKQGDLEVRMATLEGLADCHRRRGDYSRAIQYAEEALAAPAWNPGPGTPAARNSTRIRIVMLSLKLARWHGELGNLGTASALIEEVSESADSRPSQWLHAAIQDGRADRFFNLGEFGTAQQTAEEAVAEALALHDRVILLQARTTLSFVHLKNQHIPQAHVQIAGALRYRRPGRALVVLALSALAAQQKGDLYTAQRLFSQLFNEAKDRTDKDEKDFAAWDFRGVALCGRQLGTGTGFDEAIHAFERARSLTPPIPKLVERLRLVLTRLDECGPASPSLRAVIDVLADPSGRYS